MKAWWVEHPGPMATAPLAFGERADPEPGPGQVLVRVSACGVCRTDLHLAEGDLPVHRPRTVPGHEVVGRVEALGAGASRFAVGDRIGIAWLRHTCGACRYCRRGDENLCVAPAFTGWDADGGYAELADDVHAAPLLCAGIVGYRALKRAAVPPGGRLGVYGFGASAHLVAQIALAQGARVHVITRSRAAQQLALDLGADSAGPSDAPPPEPLDSAIIFAPAGELVPVALAALDKGGTLALAGIHLTTVPPLDYQSHLFLERQVRSVTANTRADGEELLALAARLDLRVATTPYPLAGADRALSDLAADRVTGAAVLVP